eukprot:2124186-Pyramimonas_sp.AAC.1
MPTPMVRHPASESPAASIGGSCERGKSATCSLGQKRQRRGEAGEGGRGSRGKERKKEGRKSEARAMSREQRGPPPPLEFY